MARIYTRTLRLNLERPDEYEAWDHLMRLDRSEIHSCNQAIVRAINYYFQAQEHRREEGPPQEPHQSIHAYRKMQTAPAHPCTGQTGNPSPDSETAAESSFQTSLHEKEKECAEAALEFLDSF